MPYTALARDRRVAIRAVIEEWWRELSHKEPGAEDLQDFEEIADLLVRVLDAYHRFPPVRPKEE